MFSLKNSWWFYAIYNWTQKSHKIDKSVVNQISLEKTNGLHLFKSYCNFEINILKIKVELINLLKILKSENKTVVGYVTTSKSTTLLNFLE